MALDRYTITLGIKVTEKMAEKIDAAAATFNVTRSAIVRDCIEKDLPKLIEREKRRRKSRQNNSKSAINTTHD